tara:strand:+ start:3489 stop:3743 length:255 start_codon:yes stop_codon:yes gene_type:complete
MKYLIKIYTKEIQTKFVTESKKTLNTIEDVHKIIIDYMGENSIEWEPNSLQFNGTATGCEFYITYEEVNDGYEQDGIIREKNPT